MSPDDSSDPVEPITTSSAVNRRNSLRRAPRSNATIEVRKGSLGVGPNLALLFLDLSEGGARVVLRKDLKKEDRVDVLISAYGLCKTIKVSEMIRWSMRLENGMHCVGIQFDRRLPYRDVISLFKP